MAARSARTTEEYMRLVCEAGRALRAGGGEEALAALAEAERGAACFLPAAHLREACGLTGAEARLLYVCARSEEHTSELQSLGRSRMRSSA